MLIGLVFLTFTVDIQLHCITFASPPVLSLPITEATFALPNTLGKASKFLAFSVHGDMVVRADRPYVRKLLEIYSTARIHLGAIASISTRFHASIDANALQDPGNARKLQNTTRFQKFVLSWWWCFPGITVGIV